MSENVKNNKMIAIITIIVLVLIGSVGGYWWYMQHRLPVLRKAPDFTLQTIDGKSQSFYQLPGKVRLVEFFYAKCPDICPMTTANMVKIQNKLKQEHIFGNPVEFVSITFDPTNDTPELLKKYADNLNVDRSSWEFMRGTDDETKKVAKGFHVFYEKNKDGFVDHTIDALFLVDGNNNIRGVYKEGDKMPTDQILKDIETLAK